MSTGNGDAINIQGHIHSSMGHLMTTDPMFSHYQQRFCGGTGVRRIERVELCQPVSRQILAGLEEKRLPALTMKCRHLFWGEGSQCSAFSNWLMSVMVASLALKRRSWESAIRR